MLNANNKVNYEPSIKQKEKKYSLATVLAWLYLKTIGRILPERWNKWAENILYYDKVIVDNGVQTDAPEVVDQSVQVSEVVVQEVQSEIMSKGETTFKDITMQTECAKTTDKNNNQAQQIADLQSKNGILEVRIEELRSIITKLKANLRSESRSSIEKDRKLYRAEKESVKNNREFVKSLESLREGSEKLEQCHEKKLTECKAELTNKIEELLERVEEVKKDRLILLNEESGKDQEVMMDNLKSQLQRTQKSKQQLEKEKIDLEDKLKDSSSKLSATETEKKELESKITSLQEQVQTLEKGKEWESAGIDDSLKQTHLDLTEMLKEELKKQEKSIEQLQKERKQAEYQSKIDIKKLEKENKVLLAEISSLKENSSIEKKQLHKQLKPKGVSKKPEDINKKTKADTKSIFSTSGSVKSKISNGLSKLLGNENLDKFLSDQNEKLKKGFPEFEGKHFFHNVLKETIQSLVYQNGYKFKSDKLLELLENNLMKSARTIIKAQVNTIVEKVGKKHSIEQVFFVEECAKGLYLNEEDSKAVIHSFTDFLAHKNNSNNDSVKEFVVQKLTKAQIKCFSDKIQGLQLPSSIRDNFLSPDEKMCSKISEENNEYQLTEKAQKQYKLKEAEHMPNSSMSYSHTTNVSKERFK